jgi:hypothetical protein
MQLPSLDKFFLVVFFLAAAGILWPIIKVYLSLNRLVGGPLQAAVGGVCAVLDETSRACRSTNHFYCTRMILGVLGSIAVALCVFVPRFRDCASENIQAAACAAGGYTRSAFAKLTVDRFQKSEKEFLEKHTGEHTEADRESITHSLAIIAAVEEAREHMPDEGSARSEFEESIKTLGANTRGSIEAIGNKDVQDDLNERVTEMERA